jgi:Ferritin-like domain
MNEKMRITDLITEAQNRRSFVKKLGIASAAVGAFAVTEARAQAPAITDIDILNFALNLEYLEAEFYTVSTTGLTLSQSGIDVTGTGTAGATTGGTPVSFADNVTQAVAKELALDEQSHVKLLRSALGAQAVAKPAINLSALGINFGTGNEFLALARALEDIGVTAYGGAAPLIQSKAYLAVAAKILAVEAEHAGAIRLLVSRNGVSTTALDGADHLPPPSGKLYFSTDSNALTEVRTPAQVLYLAYGNKSNAASGGFFPNGVNGTIKTSGSPAGATLTATPNPILIAATATGGATTITFNAPGVTATQIRLGSVNGPVVFSGSGSGSFTTGPYITDGTTFYLVDTTGGNVPALANVLGTIVVNVNTK